MKWTVLSQALHFCVVPLKDILVFDPNVKFYRNNTMGALSIFNLYPQKLRLKKRRSFCFISKRMEKVGLWMYGEQVLIKFPIILEHFNGNANITYFELSDHFLGRWQPLMPFLCGNISKFVRYIFIMLLIVHLFIMILS